MALGHLRDRPISSGAGQWLPMVQTIDKKCSLSSSQMYLNCFKVGNHAEVRARKPARGGPLRHERSHRAAAAGAPGGVEHTLE